MPEKLIDLLEETLSGVVSLWKRLTGSSGYELQESKARIPDSRGIVHGIHPRRAPRSGLDCRY
jgi:hypothetical protein